MPVGISQRVLDVVADGLVEADQDTLLLVSLWAGGAATDETVTKNAARQAMNAALREIVADAHADARAVLVASREALQHPFYGGK